ncbi:MAG: hypothetical protein C0624_10720 [Desulfuromonas sp.]|nr:MAG: hypothetical protein C0624_10720 [Desulfuromonas sp.]
MPISPPAEQLLELPEMNLMELYGRLRSLTDAAGFSGTLPAIWQCSDESQAIKKALFGYAYNSPSFNLGRVGALLDPTRLATAAHHGHDLVVVGGSHIGADERNGIGYIERVHGQVAPCCGMLRRMLEEYLQVYRRASQLIKVFRVAGPVKVEVPYKYLFRKPVGETVRLQLHLERLVDGEALGEGSLGKVYRLHPELSEALSEHLPELGSTPTPIGPLLRPQLFSFSKVIDAESREPKQMLEASVAEFLPEIVTARYPHRRLCDVHTWRQFHRIASYITDAFDGSGRNIFVLAGLTIDYSIRRNTFVPQFGFWMEQGRALEARYYNPEQVHALLGEQKIYRPPVTFLEYAGIS